MAIISKHEVIEALTRMGELAAAQGIKIELVLMGGALMMLLFGERDSTRDLDVLFLEPADTARVRKFAEIVASEHGWPDDWINDAAKGYLVGLSDGGIVFASNGIEVCSPSVSQLLAMKLCAWRDELDITDARRLLEEFQENREEVWHKISPYLIPGSELKAKYALDDLWEAVYGKN